MKDLSEQLMAASVSKEEEIGKRLGLQTINAELRLTVDKLRLDMDSLQSQLNAFERARNAEATTLKAAVREASKEAAEKARALARKTKELDDLRNTFDTQLASAERKAADENAILRKRVAEADHIVRTLEAANSAEDQRSQIQIEKVKERAGASISQMEHSLREQMEKNQLLSERNKELESHVQAITEERSSLFTAIEDAQSTIGELQEDLSSARGAVVDLTNQLAESQSLREEGAKRASVVFSTLSSHSVETEGYNKNAGRIASVPVTDNKARSDDDGSGDEEVFEEADEDDD